MSNMSRLPLPGSDDGSWGDILNDYLTRSHKPDGTIKDGIVSSSTLQTGAVTTTKLATGAVTASAIADDAVTATQIQDGTIQEAQLAPAVADKLNAPAAIADGSVGEVKLATAVQAKLNAGGDLPEVATRTAAEVSPDNLLGKTNRYDTSGAAVSQSLPSATPGRVLAIGWDAGSNALSLTAAGGDVVGSGNSTTFAVPLPGELVTLHCTTAGRWRVVGGFKPQSSLDARFAPITGATRRRVGYAVVGDSITSFESSNLTAWHWQIGQISRQRCLARGYFATGGFTLEQIEATHLQQALSLDPVPQVVILAGGTNNTGSAGSTYSEAASWATLLRMIAACEAKGVMPALWTLPPRDDSATVRQAVARWNARIYDLALTYGFPVVDAYAALVNPATGLYIPTLKQDDVHPNRRGQLAIAQQVLAGEAFTERIVDFIPDLAKSNIDAANLATNGLFILDANSDGTADGWSGSTTAGVTRSLIDVDVGKAQRISVASGATPGGWLRQDIPIIAGRRYSVTLKARVDLDPTSTSTAFTVSAQWRDASAAITPTEGGSNALIYAHSLLDTELWGYRDRVAPTGATMLRLEAAFNSGGAASRTISGQFQQITVRDLTAIRMLNP